MRTRTLFIAALVIGGSAAAPSIALHAYSSYARWASSAVDFYINPQNADVPATAAESALQTGAAVWSSQSDASFKFVYAGRVNDTSISNDGRNVVFFRNSTSGGAIASTYSWWSGDRLLDSDIIFWDGGFTFFAGSGCGGSNAAYIDDIAAHEFGHALGLNHSARSDATMYAGYSTCSQQQRTLAADDVAGVEALYPPSGTNTNTPPAVSISAPSNGATFSQGAAISFSASASDAQDGNLTSRITWRSSLDGQLGSGGTLSRALSVGTHLITASVTDSSNLSGSSAVTIAVATVSSSPDPTPTLTASGYKVKGQQRARLTWRGLTSTNVDIFRNGVLVVRGRNSGSWTDLINQRGGGSYTYVVCAAATATCTNHAVVSF